MKSKLKAIRSARVLARSIYSYLDTAPIQNEAEEALMDHVEGFIEYTQKWADPLEGCSTSTWELFWLDGVPDRPAHLSEQRADLDKRAPYRHS